MHNFSLFWGITYVSCPSVRSRMESRIVELFNYITCWFGVRPVAFVIRHCVSWQIFKCEHNTLVVHTVQRVALAFASPALFFLFAAFLGALFYSCLVGKRLFRHSYPQARVKSCGKSLRIFFVQEWQREIDQRVQVCSNWFSHSLLQLHDWR